MYPTTRIYIDKGDLERIELGFIEIRGKVMLDYEGHQERKSIRHKWVTGKKWNRIDSRGSTMKEPSEVPFSIRQKALDAIRMQITYPD